MKKVKKINLVNLSKDEMNKTVGGEVRNNGIVHNPFFNTGRVLDI